MITRSILIFTLFALCAMRPEAQVLSEGMPKGGGTFSDCDSSLVVDLTVSPLGDLEQSFTALIEPGNTTVLGTTWTYFTDELQQQDGAEITVTYPAPGEVPVCLTASAIDLSSMEACSSTTCRFVEILQDPSCLTFEPDFTIASVQGNTIIFEETSVGDSATYFWTFNEGLTAVSSNTFDGPGPHKVCLTQIGPDPVNCTSTICKWLYLGPGDVPCDQVVAPGFLRFQQENFVVVLDTSIVSGQNSSIHWDFGDGYTAEGPIAVHEYPPSWNQFQLCAQIDVWGPLVADTCMVQRCEMIDLGGSVAGIEGIDAHDLIIAPNPVSDRLWIKGAVAPAASVLIWDGKGRLVYHEASEVVGSNPIDVSSLSPGLHTIQLRAAGTMRTARFMKL